MTTEITRRNMLGLTATATATALGASNWIFAFDEDGNVWTCNSNAPVRHTERGRGSIIKLELIETD